MSPRTTISLAVVLALLVGYIYLVDRPQAQRAEQAKRLLQLSSADISTIALVSSKGEVGLSRRDATHWDVTRPVRVPAASFAVSSLLDTITGIVPQRTLGSGGNLGEYGLDKPAAQITLGTSRGQTVTLDIGKPSAVGSTSYARVQPGGKLYQIDSSTKDALAKSATDLRQKTVADFANADVQKVRIVSPAGTLAVNRLGPDRWQIEGPHAWPADDFKITDLFFPLTTSEAKVFHDGAGALAPYGLDHPAVTVDLTLRDRPEPLRILLSRRGKITYATVPGTPTVLELDASVEGKLAPETLSLVSRRVLPYNAQDLTSVVWRRGRQALEVRRQGPGFTGGGLSDGDISGMFSAINLLDADRVEPLSAAPAGAPAFEIQTDGAADAKFLVRMYREPKGGWLAADPALALRYRLTATAFDGLPGPIKTFLGLTPPPAPAPKPQQAPKRPPKSPPKPK
ncbi:MAG: DUF4340 domain-containing protein [Bacillati bacterium ANGP1]|uniref:DUF4340 domain-containing protein n=1 Tax=Candidatus Segetimicrobium genomatis TaxID=2569760 RepID=A0A537K5X1_9BACT|nr:MAG: DUF4340 domain-containing protein [Terrabacteria group bacterium ANGP1]